MFIVNRLYQKIRVSLPLEFDYSQQKKDFLKPFNFINNFYFCSLRLCRTNKFCLSNQCLMSVSYTKLYEVRYGGTFKIRNPKAEYRILKIKNNSVSEKDTKIDHFLRIFLPQERCLRTENMLNICKNNQIITALRITTWRHGMTLNKDFNMIGLAYILQRYEMIWAKQSIQEWTK